MFNFIKKSLQRVYQAVSSKLQGIFGLAQIDESTLEQLQKILLEADLGIEATKQVMAELRQSAQQGGIKTGAELKEELHKLLFVQLNLPRPELGNIILLVGINGSGKTTLAAKLADFYKQQGKKVLLVAADTFRAAAVEQLEGWAKRLQVDFFRGLEGQDPAAVVYQGCEKFRVGGYDILIIDTAGRLQTKINLMQELGKIRRVVGKILPNATVSTLLTVDAMLGQNSLIQAQEFHQAVTIDGVVLTKMDGTGKGGIVVAIAQRLKVPVVFIAYGEQSGDLKCFEPDQYLSELL